MPVTTQLFAYGLRQVVGVSEESANQFIEVAGQVAAASGPAGKIISLVRRHFTDHSQALPRALGHANERAWQALAVSLAGDGLLERIGAFFSGPAPQVIQQQVKAFLTQNGGGPANTPDSVRRACLRELHQARKQGLLSAMPGTDEVTRDAVLYRGLADLASLVADARQAANGVADALPAEYPNLAQLLRQGGGGDQPPLLVVAFAHFFRREIETNEELARGMTFALLQKVARQQESGLSAVGQALASLGGRFDDLLEDVLDHLRRMDAKLDDLRARLEDLARRHDVQREAGKSQFHITITNEHELTLVRALLEEVRKLPPEAQSVDLLTLMGDVLRAAGKHGDAQATYTHASKQAAEQTQRAGSLHKAYLSALEQRHWDEALQAIRDAATLEPQSYAPFPSHYRPTRILGAGGFGTVFLCHDEHVEAEVVVKSLHTTHMERSVKDAFREAQVLRLLTREHPSIIGVQHCSYADDARTRPYIVMDYFPGVSLQAYLDGLGDSPLPLEDFQPIAWQIAVGMQAAHGKGVLHRDLKPDNVLVRRGEDGGWQVRIIDFGLAIRTRVAQVSKLVPAEERMLAGESAAGTAKYGSPEQLGEMPGVEVGRYSDVYAFGKLCCSALFRETEPLPEDWASIPTELMQMLSKCLSKRLDRRYKDFEPVVAVLQKLDPARRKSEEGERRLAELVRQALERTQGRLTKDAIEAAKAVCREHGISDDRAKAIIRKERQPWQEKAEQQEREAEARREEAARLKREREEADRLRAEQEEAARRQREVEVAARREEGERQLRQLHREALDRSQGKHTADVGTLCREHGIPADRAEAIRQEVWQQWQKDHPVRRERQAGEVVENALGMKFAWCPPGTFLMGKPKAEVGDDDEMPQHRVTLTKGFFLGVHQVTQSQWQVVMGSNPSHFKGESRPVEQVSWEDCQEFCLKLGERDGKRYRLPTEAEWEYACRAGTTTPFWFGETISTDQANYDGNYTYGRGRSGVYRKETTKVGIFPANAWGLYDVHGNVWEWCVDGKRTYTSGDIKDPVGPQGKDDARVLRGGSWFNYPYGCRSACRILYAPGCRDFSFGCRVVLCLD